MEEKWRAIYEEVEKVRLLRDKLFEYTFLSLEKMHIEKKSEQEVLVIAEDKWSENYGMCLVVTQDGKVYAAEMPGYELCNYCAGSFGQFMEIAKRYWEITDDGATATSIEVCEEQERRLREVIETIDATALEREENFWSVVAEEVGYGI